MSMKSPIAIGRGIILSVVVVTGFVLFALHSFETKAQNGEVNDSRKLPTSPRAMWHLDGLGWLVDSNDSTALKLGTSKSKDDDGDLERPRFARTDLTDEEYLKLREEYIAMLRGVEPGKPFDFTARARAIEQFKGQQEEKLSEAARSSNGALQPLVGPAWTPIVRNPSAGLRWGEARLMV